MALNIIKINFIFFFSHFNMASRFQMIDVACITSLSRILANRVITVGVIPSPGRLQLLPERCLLAHFASATALNTQCRRC